ncbi:IPT/TIG domain-containing protein [Kitasatospora sp. LaBMicrA B282]|uniref:IPT/TIG domain-containing protein n=1 Tax=Kitasatospora sp. LaBMicrA B282 TaxID=3420949 RepID=UPI003D0AAC5F
MRLARILAASALVLAGALGTGLPATADPPVTGTDEAVSLSAVLPTGQPGWVTVDWNPVGTADTSGTTQITVDLPDELTVDHLQGTLVPEDYTFDDTVSPDGHHVTMRFTATRKPGADSWMKVYVDGPSTLQPAVVTATVANPDDVNPTNNTTGIGIGGAPDPAPVTAPAPTVTAVDTATGPGTGGTTVNLTGTALDHGMVLFGSAVASSYTCTDTGCTAVAPGGTGSVPITVVTPGGSAAAPAAFAYTGPPPPAPPAPVLGGVYGSSGPAAGGSTVELPGGNLLNGQVSFGGVPATDVSCGPTLCSVTAPAGSGTVDVSITTPGGSTAITPTDQYTYTG